LVQYTIRYRRQQTNIIGHDNRYTSFKSSSLLASSPSSDDDFDESKDSPSKTKSTRTIKTSQPTSTLTQPSSSVNNNATISKTKTVQVTRIQNTDDSTNTTSQINDLLPDVSFQTSCHQHCAVTLLRKHFPTLLDLPSLSQSTAQWIYDSNITITGPKGEQLAVGIDEVLGINRALALAATTARRAGSLLDIAVGGGSSSSSPSSQGVECELIVDPEDQLKVLALWRTRLPAPFRSPQSYKESSAAPPSYTTFTGKSILDISPETGLVTNLQIQKVKINGVAIIESLGTALASVRRTARSAMSSSSLLENLSSGGGSGSRSNSGNPFLDGLLNGLQDVVEAVDALPSSQDVDIDSLGSPLYVFPESSWNIASFPIEEMILDTNFTLEEKHSTAVPADQYSTNKVPIVGSDAFVEYALIHNTLERFSRQGLHQLAGTTNGNVDDDDDVTVEKLRSLFSTDAELTTFRGSSSKPNTLLQGAGKLADFYRSLALFRQASGGDWKVTAIKTDWMSRTLVVSWEAESPLQIKGVDAFVFELPSLAFSSGRLPLISDGDKDKVAIICNKYFNDDSSIPLKVDRIENRQLSVRGTAVDSEWANSFVSAALRSGFTGNTLVPDPTIADLLRTLSSRQTKPKKVNSSPKQTASSATMPLLSDAAAASFYGILIALHRDISSIGTDTKITIPAGDYMSGSVELRGLLGEVLVRGSTSYSRILGLAMSSLRAAIQTGRVRLAARPRLTVEVTSRGSIKVDLILALWIDAPTFPLGNDNAAGAGFGVPLKIQIASEYIIDKDGKIREHAILESRLNGVLTPGDVFSRWIKSLTASEQEEEAKGPSALDQLVGAISWVRSMQDRNKK
jgi:hypothetical protein